MRTENLKNLDKQVVGCDCYDTANDEWVTIVKVYENLCTVKICGDNNVYEVNRAHLYPEVEGLGYDGWAVCYEVDKRYRYPYYCPKLDKNLYENEVSEVEGKRNENTGKGQVMNVDINNDKVPFILDSIIRGLEDVFSTQFILNEEERIEPTFIGDALYQITSLQRVFDILNNNTPAGVVSELFNKYFIPTCRKHLLTPEQEKELSSKQLEHLVDDLNGLDYPVLNKIYCGDKEAIEGCRKELGIDSVKKTYKVNATFTRYYSVEVEAKDEREAKEKAYSSLLEFPVPSNCSLLSSIPEVTDCSEQ